MKNFVFYLFLILFSCSDFIDTWDSYIIKKGDHYSKRSSMARRLFSLQEGRHMHFQAKFTSSCLYEPYYDDLNKLYGFTDCNSLIHDNSIRFAWRHDGNGKIEIFAYWYNDGKREIYKMGETDINIEDDYELWAKNGYYYFRFNNIEFSSARSKDCEHGVRARCFPYFGGNEPAPQDIKIFIYEFN